MDFICNYIYPMLFTDIQNFPDLFLFPDSSYRIVWRTEHEKLYIILHNFLFKVLVIHHISLFDTPQGAFYNLSSIIDQRIPKRIIHRRHDKYTLLLLGQDLYNPVNCRNYSWRKTNPFPFRLIIMIRLLPSDECFFISN